MDSERAGARAGTLPGGSAGRGGGLVPVAGGRSIPSLILN